MLALALHTFAYTLTQHGVVGYTRRLARSDLLFGLIARKLIVHYYFDSIVPTPGIPTMTTNTIDIILNNDYLREDEGIVLDIEVSAISQML